MRLARTAAPLPRCAKQGLADRSRTCDLRRPKPAGRPLPHSQTKTPGGTRTRASGLRTRRHSRSTTGAREESRRSWSRTRPCSSSASRAATDTDLRWDVQLRRQGSNLLLAINSRASYPFDHAGSQERDGEVAPAGFEPAPCRVRVGSSGPVELRSRECGRQDSNLRRVAFQATALPPLSYGHVWRWARLDSNQQPLVRKTSALRD
jgi:hypothetical protein